MITSTVISTGTITAPTVAFKATDTGLTGGSAQTTAVTTVALCNIGTPDLTDETVETVSVNIHLCKATGSLATPSQRNVIVSNLIVPAGETVFFSDERIILDGDDSIWIGATSGATDTAGSFIAGRLYIIETTGSTNFTLIGAADSNPGTIFQSTGIGSGSGTARRIMVVSTVSSLPV